MRGHRTYFGHLQSSPVISSHLQSSHAGPGAICPGKHISSHSWQFLRTWQHIRFRHDRGKYQIGRPRCGCSNPYQIVCTQLRQRPFAPFWNSTNRAVTHYIIGLIVYCYSMRSAITISPAVTQGSRANWPHDSSSKDFCCISYATPKFFQRYYYTAISLYWDTASPARFLQNYSYPVDGVCATGMRPGRILSILP
jgi:hypothetical protein